MKNRTVVSSIAVFSAISAVLFSLVTAIVASAALSVAPVAISVSTGSALVGFAILAALATGSSLIGTLLHQRNSSRLTGEYNIRSEEILSQEQQKWQEELAELNAELLNKESALQTSVLRCLRMETGLTLLSKAAPVIARLSQTAIDKSEKSSTELTEQVFELAERSRSLSSLITEFLSDMTDGNDSLEGTISELSFNITQLNQTRELNVQADKSLSGYITTINNTVSESSLLLNQIEEIAQLTNILAINAAIYAAQAGKHGLGFGVIAGEIQKLSRTTEKVSKTITKNTQEVSTQFSSFANAHRSFMENSQNTLTQAADSLEATIVKLQPKVLRIGQSVRDAAAVSEFVNEQLNGISEEMQGHDAIQQIVSHMSEILGESLKEAQSYTSRENIQHRLLDPEEAVRTIAGRHLTMKEEYLAVGHEGYNTAEQTTAVLANGTKLSGDITLF